LFNPSSEINNGVARVAIKGGHPPYHYKWSNVNTPLVVAESVGLIEGMEHSVIISDANGNSVSKTFTIPAKSITEIFNSKVQPAVDVLGAVLFWDAFSAIGIYDPVVYTSHENIPLPRRDIITDEDYLVKSWLAAEGSLVKEGEKIAVLESSKNIELSVFAPTEGTLKYVTQEGAI
ncbi:amino acid carrier protein, partial [Bizionia gelidisalsuginis]